MRRFARDSVSSGDDSGHGVVPAAPLDSRVSHSFDLPPPEARSDQFRIHDVPQAPPWRPRPTVQRGRETSDRERTFAAPLQGTATPDSRVRGEAFSPVAGRLGVDSRSNRHAGAHELPTTTAWNGELVYGPWIGLGRLTVFQPCVQTYPGEEANDIPLGPGHSCAKQPARCGGAKCQRRSGAVPVGDKHWRSVLTRREVFTRGEHSTQNGWRFKSLSRHAPTRRIRPSRTEPCGL
jgi:hypothetical protein